MSNTYSGWHVLYVKSRHEKKVDLLLKESELDSFLPTITTLRQWSDRKKKVIKPLFPSYVFINTKSKNDFFKALGFEGVFKYLKFGGEYAKVREREIYQIKRLLNLDGIADVSVGGWRPNVGEKMSISYGPLAGLQCEVLRIKNENKIFVSIGSLRQTITAVVPLAFLKQRTQRITS